MQSVVKSAPLFIYYLKRKYDKYANRDPSWQNLFYSTVFKMGSDGQDAYQSWLPDQKQHFWQLEELKVKLHGHR